MLCTFLKDEQNKQNGHNYLVSSSEKNLKNSFFKKFGEEGEGGKGIKES